VAVALDAIQPRADRKTAAVAALLLTLTPLVVEAELADIATIKDFILIPDIAVATAAVAVQLHITRRHTVQEAAAALVLTDRAITVLADQQPRADMAPAAAVEKSSTVTTWAKS
jgi:hypothetical protein